MKNFLKDNFKTIIIILIIGLFFMYYIAKPSNDYVELSPQEKTELEIENLKTEKGQLEEKLSHANGRIEELEREYKYDEELINMLQEQLLNNGIEPIEL